jgi:potassium voltage-gated channel Eag-related subfamily H protein 7
MKRAMHRKSHGLITPPPHETEGERHADGGSHPHSSVVVPDDTVDANDRRPSHGGGPCPHELAHQRNSVQLARAGEIHDAITSHRDVKKQYDSLNFNSSGSKAKTDMLVASRQKYKEHQKAHSQTSDKLNITFTNEEGCMNGLILHPLGPRTKQWDIFIAVLLIYTAYVTPYEVAFLETKFNAMFVVNQFVNLSFFCDMVKTFFTAHLDKEHGVLQGDLSKIAKNYMMSWFIIDLVSIAPFDSVGLATKSEALQKAKGARIIRLLRLLKLLRLLRSMRIFTRYQDSIAMTYASKSLIRFSVLIITAMHWMACGVRLLPDLMETANPLFNGDANGRYAKYLQAGIPGMSVQDDTGIWDGSGEPAAISWLTLTSSANTPIVDLGPPEQYTWALYWSAMTLTTIGYGDIAAKTDPEAVWMTLGMIIGSSIYAYAIGEVCGIVANMDAATTEYNRQSDLLNYFCAENGMPQSLRVRLRKYFRVGRQMQRDKYFKGLLDNMSPTLRSEVTIFLNADQLLGIPFFNIGAENEHEYHNFLAQITMRMETKLFAASEIVIGYGDRMRGVYLVSKGLAFGGRQEPICKWGVHPVGKWFGAEGLLLARRHMYEMRALKLLQTEFIAKASLDEVLDEGDFENVHWSVRLAVMKHVFLLSVKRYTERLSQAQLQAEAEGKIPVTVMKFRPTPHELAYIRDGVYADLKAAEEEGVRLKKVKWDSKNSLPAIIKQMAANKTHQDEKQQTLEQAMVAQTQMMVTMSKQVGALTEGMSAMQMEMGSMRAAIARTVPAKSTPHLLDATTPAARTRPITGSLEPRKVGDLDAIKLGNGPPAEFFKR